VRIAAFDNNKIISLTIRFILLFIITVIIFALSYTRQEYIREASAEEWTLDSAISALSYKYGVSEQDARSIIKCESEFKIDAFNINKDRTLDYGLFQINTYWHLKSSRKLGMDIFTARGNLEYGFYLLANDGVKHWKSSNACHGLVK